MKIILTGIFFIMHGLVHLLYAGQSHRLFELRPKMIWPDGSWVFSRLLGNDHTRLLGSISLIIAALSFLLGGVGLFARLPWWRTVMVAAAVFSSAIFILLWDGKFQALDDKGGVGILINLLILIAVLVFNWPF